MAITGSLRDAELGTQIRYAQVRARPGPDQEVAVLTVRGAVPGYDGGRGVRRWRVLDVGTTKTTRPLNHHYKVSRATTSACRAPECSPSVIQIFRVAEYKEISE